MIFIVFINLFYWHVGFEKYFKKYDCFYIKLAIITFIEHILIQDTWLNTCIISITLYKSVSIIIIISVFLRFGTWTSGKWTDFLRATYIVSCRAEVCIRWACCEPFLLTATMCYFSVVFEPTSHTKLRMTEWKTVYGTLVEDLCLLYFLL